MTCGCSRIALAGHGNGCLIAASHPARRTATFEERVLAFIGALGKPAAAFTPDGAFIGGNVASDEINDFVSAAPNLLNEVSEAELSKRGSADITTALGRVTIYHVGADAEGALIALLPETSLRQGKLQSSPAHQSQPIARENVESVTPQTHAPSAAPAETEQGNLPVLENAAKAEAFPELRHDVEKIEFYTEQVPDEGQSSSLAPLPPSAPPSMSDKNDLDRQPEPAAPAAAFLALPEDPVVQPRRYPLRFLWQMDAEGRFSFGSDEFARVIGQHTAAAFGRLWSDVAEALNLDPMHQIQEAVNTRNTFGGIVLQWPVDGFGARLPVELSGLPLFDRHRTFAGYRGFGICRDLEGLTRIEAQRRQDTLFGSAPLPSPSAASAQVKSKDPVPTPPAPVTPAPEIVAEPEAPAPDSSHPVATEDNLEPPQNVVPFRPAGGEGKPPSLTPVENNAFQEIARQLSERLETEASRLLSDREHVENQPASGTPETAFPPPVPTPDAPVRTESFHAELLHAEPAHADAVHLQPAPLTPRQSAAPDPQLYDHLPTGVLVYQLDRLIYANPAFLKATGYTALSGLIDDGGLDALYVEAGPSETEDGRPITISTSRMGHAPGLEGQLHTIAWGSDNALALMLSPAPTASVLPLAEAIRPAPAPVPEQAQFDDIEVEELATILEITAEGVVMFDGLGRISGCNRSAEALFGLSAPDIAGKNLIDLFAPESQSALLDYLDGVKAGNAQSVLDHGRDVLGRTPNGGTLPLSVTMGRTRPVAPRYFAVFRDRTPAPAVAPPVDPDAGRRSSERTASAKADMLARLSHEIRMPVNAIIGFAEVMIEERFGPLGNERYVDYMKDIRASGERVVSIIDDMLDLSRIESGKIDLAFTNQDLNALVEQCVAVMQPQANRERIIIRSSLTHALPHVRADARALRQIALNLIGGSIHFANAGGQVIVSTAVTDLGGVAMRVRDTG
ncbi:MAG: PAS domain S-box protein, partial [Xanthobacteraceae bacterium]|nr:PAS domain S-box protein [Xanthobacteraceae bacterium]